jgi:drug/metabolite transporter (DMT)-like permease
MTSSDASADRRQDYVKAIPALFVVLWGTGFIGAKLGLPDAPPLKFLLWRFAIVIAIMIALALAFRAPWPRGRQLAHVAVAGVLMQAIYLGGVFTSIDLGLSAGVSALIVGLQPVLTALAGRFIGEPVAPRQWAGFALGFAGVAMVVWHKLALGGIGWPALAPCIAALIGITAGTIYQKRYCSGGDLRTQSVVQFCAAAAFLLPLSLAFETRSVVWSANFVFAVLWLVLVLSLGAITLLMLLIRRGAATTVSSLMYLVPPVTALFAYWLFDERLTALALAGMAVAVAGVALVVRK